ncbi:rubrerythrin [Desulfocurvus sp.]|jgi:rubrerythrin|uniref:rubrerythrin n=1 Tax=Desulfocurvus sp. TaxID=2871698 RepID=UPI0025C43BB6|nr:rubrerythrin family protein [Desulfocurvus sp.]MCK9240827.1 rubrerythrin family protein [Desulfocurvus sp.]
MKPLKGSRTEKNILTAFAGESQARNRYDYFASIAKKEGFVQIERVFQETALQEKEHAKRLFKFLEGGEAEICAAFPAGRMGTTLENLYASAEGEHHEWEEMYPEFAHVADEEGFGPVAAAMRAIARAEAFHEERYRAFIENIEQNRVFTRPGKTAWRCLNCGYVHEGAQAPHECPACAHPQAFFELLFKNW